jgi:cobalt-zinc-cadmium efflux system membrane fusion protein
MKKNIIYTVLASMLLFACSDKKTAEQEVLAEESAAQEIVLTQNQLNNIELSYINMEQKGIGAIIKANGTIDVPPESMVSISAPMGGYLKYTRLQIGRASCRERV